LQKQGIRGRFESRGEWDKEDWESSRFPDSEGEGCPGCFNTGQVTGEGMMRGGGQLRSIINGRGGRVSSRPISGSDQGKGASRISEPAGTLGWPKNLRQAPGKESVQKGIHNAGDVVW